LATTTYFHHSLAGSRSSGFTSLAAVKGIVGASNIKLGAQNMHFEERGAYTGEISPLMIKGNRSLAKRVEVFLPLTR